MEPYDPQIVEKEILEFWDKKRIFDKLRKTIKGKKPFSFIDGPITANNPMGVHHAWGRTYKDVFQRWRAMQGFDQRFQNGFDCQGLWVEVEVEKDLGFNSKKEITDFGLDKFSKACKDRVGKFSGVITGQSIRLGQWMDWKNSYFTMDDNNIEHIWHFLKECHKKGWLYEGVTAMPWCWRCGTSLSQHELIDSYDEATHDSVYVALPIKGRKDENLLIWTTTPWTLPANVAVAVNPGMDYVLIEFEGRFYYVSNKVVSKIGRYRIIKKLKGRDLEGFEYGGPFDELGAQSGVKHKVIGWTDVSDEEGTGLVHIAPGCGAEDFELGKKYGLVTIVPIDEGGKFVDGFGEFTDKHVKGLTEELIKNLDRKGILFKKEKYKHRYPYCWRCKAELVFRVEHEWFISSKEIRPLMKKAAKSVNWYPKHAGKLMQDWLDNMGDWCISRKRFWGLPLPVWECHCGHKEVVGSLKELKEKAVSGMGNLKELHRPWIDGVVIKCPQCGSKATRIPDVGDCWLDAGIVPFSTLGYLKDKKYWKKWFPANLIIEMREQIRLWFYSLLFMGVTLTGDSPYRNVFVYEKVYDEKGTPMHKSLGNAIWFDDAAKKMGADVMRWLYVQQNPSLNINFGYTPAAEVLRQLKVIWNLANYVGSYTQSDGSSFDSSPEARWILSRLESTKSVVTDSLEKMQPHKALNALHQFLVEDLSRTYGQFIREDLEKKEVQNTLRKCFKESLIMLAPICPFMSEKVYLEIFKNKESIFLEDWPSVDKKKINKDLESQMSLALGVIQEILSQREKAQIGVRWPLARAVVKSEPGEVKAVKRFAKTIQKQTNVKRVKTVKEKVKGSFLVDLDTHLTKALEAEGYVRELTRKVQDLRKKSGLNKSDEIDLFVVSSFTEIQKFKKEISKKVGARNVFFELKHYKIKSNEKIKDKAFSIGLKKV